MKRLLGNIALLLGISLIVAPVAMTQTQNPYVLTAAKIATVLGYTPANGSLYCALTGCTLTGPFAATTAQFNTGGTSATALGVDSNFTAYNAFSLNGLLTDAGVMGFIGGGGTDKSLFVNTPSGGTIVLRVSGVPYLTIAPGSSTFANPAVMKNYTVSTLPTGITYGRAFISDQLTACVATGLALTGGGAVTCPVYYNGSAWVGG